MSNYLAIATVTAVLKRIIQEGISYDVPGAQVTTNRPEAPTGNISGAIVNLFLYSATPNPAWRNADLRTRRPKGEMVKHGQAGLDLNYIFTFYGNEQYLEPQRLLGSTIQSLVDHPVISREMIQDTITSGSIPQLIDSTLDEQVQSVKFLPGELPNEELSRLWSVFFQIPYSLSFTYQATAVLIQGRKPGKAPLPVRGRRFYTSPSMPSISKVDHQGEPGDPITIDSHLVIHGNQLESDRARVQIGDTELTPMVVTQNRIAIMLSALPAHERDSLRAGVQGLRVVLNAPQFSTQDTGFATNVLPLVLCPTIVNGQHGLILSELEEVDDAIYSATVTTEVDLMVSVDQSVFLLLNGDSSPAHDGTYIIRGDRRSQDTHELTFRLNKVRAGDYLVRVQINGAESLLEVDTDSSSPSFEQYVGPSISIGSD
jgi:hypothetical protein